MIRPADNYVKENSADSEMVVAEAATTQKINIRDVLARRSDLSTFIVHLTKNENGESAHERLKTIINDWTIKAGQPLGSAIKKLTDKRQCTDSQKCGCFTETPLEYLYLLCLNITGRATQLAPYGVAITKEQARKGGANPVWYVDITPGHNWLMNPLNELIDQAIDSGDFGNSQIAKIAPFVEQMGDNRKTGGDLKEFWWEREWRRVGDFELPDHVILICPEGEHGDFEQCANQDGHSAKCVDANWGLEQIIARLAGFDNNDIDIL